LAAKFLNLILQEDGILIEEFDNLPSGFILKGGYRKISNNLISFLVCYPENVEHELVNYETKDQDLINPFYKHIPTLHFESGKYRGLILKFTLKKSGYATMLIRELTKTSSSLEYQQKLGALYV
jgi:tRNA(Glu) U13 pseudouridine synthase TruD